MAPQKTVIVGGGPVGALAALYAARRGHDVEVYELRGGMLYPTTSLSALRSFAATPRRNLREPRSKDNVLYIVSMAC